MFRVFDYGRGNYSYINPSREWQQAGTSFGKIIMAHAEFMPVLEKEGVTSFPAKPTLPDVARFEFFAKSPEKQEGVWLYRRGKLRFALPITVGTKPAIADYLPAPFGLPGFSAPVEEVYPSFVPFVKLADGKQYAAADGADEIVPGPNGQSLKIVNRKWAQVGSKSGERFDIGLRSEVEFRVQDGSLVRTETVTADKPVEIALWQFIFPSTADNVRQEIIRDGRAFDLSGREGTTRLILKIDGAATVRTFAAGDSKLSKGVLGSIPLHLVVEKQNVKLATGQKLSWEVSAEPQ
jgi:hypothetical protein